MRKSKMHINHLYNDDRSSEPPNEHLQTAMDVEPSIMWNICRNVV